MAKRLGGRTVKASISMPAGVLEAVDRLAQMENKTRSGLLTDLARRYAEGKKRQLMAEGYKAMAGLDLEIAEADMAAVHEVWPDYG